MAKGKDRKPDYVPPGKAVVKGEVLPIDEELSPVDRGADFVKSGETVKTTHGYKP